MSYTTADRLGTLLARVTAGLEHERVKHGKDDDHVSREVNSWSNMKLLDRMSDALDEMFAAHERNHQ